MFDEIGGRLRGETAQFARAQQVVGTAVLFGQPLRTVATGQCRFQQFLRIASLLAGLPHGVAHDHLHRFDPCLSTPAPLDHALHCFEGVVVHGVRTADTHHQRFLDVTVQREFQVGQPPGDRQARARKHRETEPLRVGHHFQAPVEAVGEVLVVVDRYRAAILFEYLDTGLEHLVARVALLSFFVVRIIAMLANDQDTVHRQGIPAAPQRFGDGGVDLEAELAGAVGTLVAFGPLVDVERHHLHVRPVPAA